MAKVELIHYDAACRALAPAKSVDEVKGFRDKAGAIRVHAWQLKNKKLEIDAAGIRIRATERWGELRGEEGKARGAAAGGKKSGPRGAFVASRDKNPTLEEMAISKDVSARAHKLAELPERVFEEKVAAWREIARGENERVTTNLLKIGDKQQKHVRGTFGTGEKE